MMLLGCTAAPRPPVARPTVTQVNVVEDARGQGVCRRTDGESLASDLPLVEVMRQAVNPSLSRISWLLFHDSRAADDDARSQQLARAAHDLARCFTLLPKRAPARGERTEFELLSIIQAHNASALADAALQNDVVSQRHWYLHIKETCQSCHEQFRFGAARERGDIGWDTESAHSSSF